MIAIIGAGITGLVAAYHLQQAGKAVQLFEASDRVGGNIHTLGRSPYRLEAGPNTIQLDDELYELLEKLGIAEELIFAEEAAKYRYILRSGRYWALPTGPISLLVSSTLSWKAKRRLLKELRLPAEEVPGESLEAFFTRRFGREITQYVVAPFVSGVYAGDPAQLLIEKAMPRIKAHERNEGSVIKGAMKAAKGRKRKGIFSFPQGLAFFPHTLQQQLGRIVRLNCPVTRISQSADFEIETAQGSFHAEQVLACLPAYQIAALVADERPELSELLKKVNYAPISVRYAAFDRDQVSHPLNGFGALHNHLENRYSLGSVFSSTIFPKVCPEDEVLLTTFVGGALYPQRAMAPEAEIEQGVRKDYVDLLGVKGKENFSYLKRWPQGIPQYDAAIGPAQAAADQLEQEGLLLGGNWRGGISVPNCIAQGKKLAETALANLE